MWRKTLSGTPDTLTMDCRNHLYIAARNSSLLEVARLLGTAEGRELINKDDGSGDVGLLCILTYISDRKRIEVLLWVLQRHRRVGRTAAMVLRRAHCKVKSRKRKSKARSQPLYYMEC